MEWLVKDKISIVSGEVQIIFENENILAFKTSRALLKLYNVSLQEKRNGLVLIDNKAVVFSKKDSLLKIYANVKDFSKGYVHVCLKGQTHCISKNS